MNDNKRGQADVGEAWIVAQEDMIVARILGLSMG